MVKSSEANSEQKKFPAEDKHFVIYRIRSCGNHKECIAAQKNDRF